MKVYKVGLIGYGFIGKVHTYGHRNIPLFYDQQEFRSEIAMVCTSKPESAAKAAPRWARKGSQICGRSPKTPISTSWTSAPPTTPIWRR